MFCLETYLPTKIHKIGWSVQSNSCKSGLIQCIWNISCRCHNVPGVSTWNISFSHRCRDTHFHEKFKFCCILSHLKIPLLAPSASFRMAAFPSLWAWPSGDLLGMPRTPDGENSFCLIELERGGPKWFWGYFLICWTLPYNGSKGGGPRPPK